MLGLPPPVPHFPLLHVVSPLLLALFLVVVSLLTLFPIVVSHPVPLYLLGTRPLLLVILLIIWLPLVSPCPSSSAHSHPVLSI